MPLPSSSGLSWLGGRVHVTRQGDRMCEPARYLDRMISEEVSEGVASTRVAIAGFSQVGITASATFVSLCTFVMLIPVLHVLPVLGCCWRAQYP